jgi:hypothetical protein
VRALLLVAALLVQACARAATSPAPDPIALVPATTTRTFRMGFTTAPGGPRGGLPNAPAPTLRFVRTNGDLVVLHRDGPHVPWRALANGHLKRFRRQLAQQRLRLGTGPPLYVLITPLNIFRTGIGGDWPSALGPACISNPRLQAAFKNYARVVLAAMQPDYLALGGEVNMYALKPPKGCPGDFDAYVALYKETYDLVKSIRPDLPVFVTFQIDFLHLGRQQALPARFLPELDRFAISLYPGGNVPRLTPDQIPPDYVTWARASVPDLPLVVAETGYGSVAAGGAVGSPDLQQQYVAWILQESERQQAEFVTWFFSSDPRYVKVPPALDYINSFTSMGLVTPRFKPKPALDVWRAWLALPLLAAD